MADCQERDPALCELYLVEGDSAGGSAKQARDRKTQAVLPLKGKILNVEKARFDKMLSNDEIRMMISALGTGIGKDNVSADKIRYHKVIIMTDADVDGSHIRTLLLTFFYRQMPEVLEKGYIYIAQPPLYRAKKGQSETYLKDDAALTEYLLNLGLSNFKIAGKDLNDEDMKKMILSIQKLNQLLKSSAAKYDPDFIYFLISKVSDWEKKLVDLELYPDLFKDYTAWTQSNPQLGITEVNYQLVKGTTEAENFYQLTTHKYADKKTSEVSLKIVTSSLMTELKNIWAIIQGFSLLPINVKIGNEEFSFETYREFYEQMMESTKKGIYIQRYKGLGEMNPEQLWETTLNPANRRLLQVTITDAVSADETFSILMGEQVEPRRQFIHDNALLARALDV
jgi:DNA gyrase subunit B